MIIQIEKLTVFSFIELYTRKLPVLRCTDLMNQLGENLSMRRNTVVSDMTVSSFLSFGDDNEQEEGEPCFGSLPASCTAAESSLFQANGFLHLILDLSFVNSSMDKSVIADGMIS